MFPTIREDQLWSVALGILAFFPMWSLQRMVRNRRRATDTKVARVPVVTELIPREWVALLLVLWSLCIGAIFTRAEFGLPPAPSVTPSPCRAPWFFSGLQELVAVLPVTLAGRIVPIFLVIGLVAIPFVARPTPCGYELRGRGVSVLAFLTLWCGWFLLIGVGVLRAT